MPSTPILGITQVSTSQNGKETTINDAIIALENATNAKLAVSMAAGNVTLSVPEATRNFIFTAAGATEASELLFPIEVNGNPYNRVIVVRNVSGHGLTVRFVSGGGDTVTIPNGESRLISAADGLDMSVAAEPPSVITFLSLTDAPETFTGQTGKFLSVNETETALEFTDAAVFPTLAGNANRFLKVNSGATGVEWSEIDFAGAFTELSDTPASYAGQGGKLVRVNDLATGLEFVEASDAEAVNFQEASRWRILLLEPGVWPENPPGVEPGDPEFIEQTDQVGFGEVEFLDQDGIDLTGTGTATASNFLTGNEPSRAFNNNTDPADGWLTEATYVGEVWIEYDFGAPVAPRRVRLSSIDSFPQYGTTRFLIQYWDGSAWISLGDRSPAPWESGVPQTFKINGIPLDFLEEAPSNGSLYGRIDGEWLKINAEVVSDNTTTSNLDASQTFQYRRYINEGTKTLNIRANIDHPTPADGEWYVYVAVGAALSIVPAPGVTVNAPAGGSLIVPLNGTVRIKRVAVDVYDVFGDTVSSGGVGAEDIPPIIGNENKLLAVKPDASGIEWITPPVTYTDENARDALATALVAGTNVTIVNNDAANTITISAASIGLDAEQVRDTIGAALRAGTNLSWSINDAGDTITISTSALDAEGVRDTIGASLVAGANMAISVNDAANTISLAATMDTEVIQDIVADTLVAGSNTLITYDDVTGTITIDSLGGGGGGGLDAEQVRDVVGATLAAGNNITINVNDAADTITIDSTTDPEVVRDTISSALVAGSNVTIVHNDAANTITVSVAMDQEVIRDTIGSALVAGDGITITPNDAGNTITITATGGGGGGSTDPEIVRDVIGTALVAGANVTITVNDLGDTITIAASGGLDAEAVRDTIGATLVAGTNITVDVNDAANTITISSATNPETIRDTMASALVAGANITITPNDAADTITITAASDPEFVRDTIATALVAGSNILITHDDVANTITVDSLIADGSTFTIDENPWKYGQRWEPGAEITFSGLGGGNISASFDTMPRNDFYFSSSSGSQIVKIDFGSGDTKIIQGFRIFQNNGVSQGTWSFQGSNDDVNWVDVDAGWDWTPITVAGLVYLEREFANLAAFRYYRFTKTAGSTSNSPYVNWFQFRYAQTYFSGGNGAVGIDDEGVEVVPEAARINFVGAGVTVTDAGSGQVEVNIPGGGGGGGGGAVAIEDEGVEVISEASRLNFTGDGVTVTDSGAGEVEINVTGGSGGGVVGSSLANPPSIRATSAAQAFNANSVVVNWPSGTVAGDLVLIFTGHGWETLAPVGWSQYANLIGTGSNGAVLGRIMTPADISSGSVTVTFGGSFNGVVQAVSIVGSTVAGIRSVTGFRSGSAASTIPLNGDSSSDRDLALGFAFNRAASNNSLPANWTTLASVNAANGSSVFGRISNNPPVIIQDNATSSATGPGRYSAVVSLIGVVTSTLLDFDISSYFQGVPPGLFEVFTYTATRDFTLPINFEGSFAYANITPIGPVTFQIKKNDTVIGTVSFAFGENTGTFVAAEGASFVAGDRLSVVSPSDVSELANLSVSFAGTRV